MNQTQNVFEAAIFQGRVIERLLSRCEALGWTVHMDPDRRGIILEGRGQVTEPEAAGVLRKREREVFDYLNTGRPCRLEYARQLLPTSVDGASGSPAGLSGPPDLAVPDAPLDGRDRQRADSARIIEWLGYGVIAGVGAMATVGAVDLLNRFITWWRS